MTDLEITKLCAEAMGIKGFPVASGHDAFGLPTIWTEEGWKKCKDALFFDDGREEIYNPLHDDAQAMALVKKMRLYVMAFDKHWRVSDARIGKLETAYGLHQSDMNRAICECVAKMQAAEK